MTTSPDRHVDAIDDTTNRRTAIRALLVGGGAAAGAVAFGNRASAADGDSVNAGQTVVSQSPTIIDFTPAAAVSAGPSALSAGGYVPPADAAFPAGVGGYGDATVPNGVHGSTTDPDGFGVVAANLGTIANPATDAAPVGLAVASLNGPQIVFAALGSEVSGPTPGVHVAGEMYRDADGTLWFTVPAPTESDPTAARFVSLASTASSGAFHAINPQRAYDSRIAAYAESGLIAPNTNRVVSVANGHDAAGAVTLADAVPAGATAVQINLTAANPTAENFLAVTDGTTATTETSVLNWGAGTLQIANSITVPVNAAREIRVYCGNQSGSTHFLVDVFGYYL